MQLNYINKDILQAFEEDEINVILHQCNCTVGMGAGIAKKIADKYPQVNSDDIFTLSKKQAILGYTSLTPIRSKSNKAKCIINLYSQWTKGSPSDKIYYIADTTVNDDFEARCYALKNCLNSVITLCKGELCDIGIPLIASGLAKQKEYKHLSDLDYFKKFVEPIVVECFDNKIEQLNIYYL